MKIWKSARVRLVSAMSLAALLMLASFGCGKAPVKTASKKKPAGAEAEAPLTTAALTNTFLAAFEDRPELGKDPFFPASTRRVSEKNAKQTSAAKQSANVIEGLSLTGVSVPVNGRKRAFINNRPFYAGDQGPVKVPGGGVVVVTCLEVTEVSALVEVEGIGRKELILRGRRK